MFFVESAGRSLDAVKHFIKVDSLQIFIKCPVVITIVKPNGIGHVQQTSINQPTLGLRVLNG